MRVQSCEIAFGPENAEQMLVWKVIMNRRNHFQEYRVVAQVLSRNGGMAVTTALVRSVAWLGEAAIVITAAGKALCQSTYCGLERIVTAANP